MLAPALLEKKLKGELAVLQKANKSCFNCSALANYAIYPPAITVCANCASLHRSIGHHAKGFGASTFTREDVNKLQAYGNEVSSGIWLAKMAASVSKPEPGDTNACQKWIQRVFKDSEFYDEAAAASAARTADARCGRTVAKVELDTSGAPRLARPPPPGAALRSPAGSQTLAGQRSLSAVSSGALKVQPSDLAVEASVPEPSSPLAAPVTTPATAAATTPSPSAPNKTKKTPAKDAAEDAAAPAAAAAEAEPSSPKAPKKKKAAAKTAEAPASASPAPVEAETSEAEVAAPKRTKTKKATAKAAEAQPEASTQEAAPAAEETAPVEAAPKKTKKKKKVAPEDGAATEASPSVPEAVPAFPPVAAAQESSPRVDTGTEQSSKKVKGTKKVKKVKAKAGDAEDTPEAAAADVHAASAVESQPKAADQKAEEAPAVNVEASEASVAKIQSSPKAAEASAVPDLLGGMLPQRQAFDPFPTAAPGPSSATGAAAPAPHAAVVDPFAPKPDPVPAALAPPPVSTVAASRTGDNDGVPTPSAAYGAVNSLQPFNPFEATPQGNAAVPGLGPYGPTPIAPNPSVIPPQHNPHNPHPQNPGAPFGSQQTSGAYPQQFPVPQNRVQLNGATRAPQTQGGYGAQGDYGAAAAQSGYGMYAQAGAPAPAQPNHSYDAAPVSSAQPPKFPNFAANAHSAVPQQPSTHGSTPQSMPGASPVVNSGAPGIDNQEYPGAPSSDANAPFQGSMQPPQPTAGVMENLGATPGVSGYPVQPGAAAEAAAPSATGMNQVPQGQPFASTVSGGVPQPGAVGAPQISVVAPPAGNSPADAVTVPAGISPTDGDSQPSLPPAPVQHPPQPAAQDSIVSRETSMASVPPVAAGRTGSRPGSPSAASAAKRAPLSANLFAAPQVAAQVSAQQGMQYGGFGMAPAGWPGQAQPQGMHPGMPAYGSFAGQNTGYQSGYYGAPQQMYPGGAQQQYGVAPTGGYNWPGQMMQGQGGFPGGGPQGMGMQWPQGAQQPGGPVQAGQPPMGPMGQQQQHQMGQQRMGQTGQQQQLGQPQMGQMGHQQMGQQPPMGQQQIGMGQHQMGQPGGLGQMPMQQQQPGAPQQGMMMNTNTAGTNAPAGGNPFGQAGGAADPNLSNAFGRMGM